MEKAKEAEASFVTFPQLPLRRRREVQSHAVYYIRPHQ
jgi:hypothetical protein